MLFDARTRVFHRWVFASEPLCDYLPLPVKGHHFRSACVLELGRCRESDKPIKLLTCQGLGRFPRFDASTFLTSPFHATGKIGSQV